MRRRLIQGTAIAVLLCFVYILYAVWSIISFAKVNELIHTDAAIVLGAAVWDDKPSTVLENRLNHAIWLYNNGYIKKIIVTGGTGKGDSLSEAEVSKRYVMQYKVPGENIVLEEHSKITEQNLANSHALARQQQINTFTIVSDPLHMKRAFVMTRHLGMDAYSSPTQTSAYKSLGTKLPFLLRETFFLIGYQLKMLFLK
ncbi:multidrug MFS transporter [Paenibacillus sp. FSL A5-0031]|uniref:YdcF family protein n=1 Tax=Paenibacillus sp. FSL A5-0031 TaxID=1920420 RepID=UPI00096D25A9|nr:YdcF family protein [Paenibacillus sp. FSL A5-0031]OME76470.1 multidrug MFS transporter [Paenibacillus sp. FSL A5-0031]